MKKMLTILMLLTSISSFAQDFHDQLIYTNWRSTNNQDEVALIGFGLGGGAAVTMNGNIILAVSDFKIGKLKSDDEGHEGQMEILLIRDGEEVTRVYRAGENCILLPGTQAPEECLQKKKIVPIFRG